MSPFLRWRLLSNTCSDDTNAAPAPVVQHVALTPAAPVLELNCVSPFQQFDPYFMAADSAVTAVELSAPQVDGLRPLLDSRIQDEYVLRSRAVVLLTLRLWKNLVILHVRSAFESALWTGLCFNSILLSRTSTSGSECGQLV